MTSPQSTSAEKINAIRTEVERCADTDELFWIGMANEVLNSWFAFFLSLAALVYSILFVFNSLVESQIWKDSENSRTFLSRKIVKGIKEYKSSFPWSHHIIFFISSSAITLFAVWTFQSKIPFLNNHCI